MNTADFFAISTSYFGLVHVFFMRKFTFGWYFKFIPVDLVVLVGVLSYITLHIEALSNVSGSFIYKFFNSLGIPIQSEPWLDGLDRVVQTKAIATGEKFSNCNLVAVFAAHHGVDHGTDPSGRIAMALFVETLLWPELFLDLCNVLEAYNFVLIETDLANLKIELLAQVVL